jgi:uncharacterized membrane protein
LTQRNLWIRRISLGAIALGLLLRFAHLDRKVYWHDEVFTSLRVAGYLGPAVAEQVRDRPDLTATDLLRYQDFPPAPSLKNTWTSLADHPEHPPLYYLLAHGWGRLFGASVAGYRAIAAIFGAIALGAMFWLGRQLFPGEAAIAWIATALLALSPVQIIYSQEAREYSLWAVGLLLAHGALVRALVRARPWDWVAYGLALALAWYGSLMTVLLGLSHLVFMLLSQQRRRLWLDFVAAHSLALVLFVPWIWVLLRQEQRLQAVTAWTTLPSPPGVLERLWGLHYSATVVDFNLPLFHGFSVVGPALVLALLAIALGYLGRRRPVALFLACGLLVPPLALIGADLARQGQMSGTTRYFFPSLVLVPLVIAPLIDHWLKAEKWSWRYLGALLLGLLLGLGLASGLTYSRADTWWNKGISSSNRAIAAYLNQQPTPLVVLESTDRTLGEAISLSRYLKADTPLWLMPGNTLPPATVLQPLLATRPQLSLMLVNPTGSLLESIPPGWPTTANQSAGANLVWVRSPD